jgi:hypothetical protein
MLSFSWEVEEARPAVGLEYSGRAAEFAWVDGACALHSCLIARIELLLLMLLLQLLKMLLLLAGHLAGARMMALQVAHEFGQGALNGCCAQGARSLQQLRMNIRVEEKESMYTGRCCC